MSVYVCVVPLQVAAVAVATAVVAVVVTEAGVGVVVAVVQDGVVVARETSDEEWELPQSVDCYRCSSRAVYLGHDRSRAKEETQDMNWVGCIEASGAHGSWRGMSHGGRIGAPWNWC